MTPSVIYEGTGNIGECFFVTWDHPEYGKIKVLNNPIKLSKTPAEIKSKGPELGEHTEDILKQLGYEDQAISKMKDSGVI